MNELDPQWLSWIAQAFTATATISIAIIAYWQLGDLNKGRKREFEIQKVAWTLQSVNRYESDQSINDAANAVTKHISKQATFDDNIEFELAAKTVLNFLDSIAIGIQQKLYDEDTAKEYLINIVRHQVDDLLIPKLGGSYVKQEFYPHLLHIYGKWCHPEPGDKNVGKRWWHVL